MKNKSRSSTSTFGLAILLGLTILSLVAGPTLTPDVSAQVDTSPYGHTSSIRPVANALGADNTDVAILVQYIGDSGDGEVAVAAGGDLTFISGVDASEAADTSFECPISGALGGVIDVSDTACDTLGEVVDTINGKCTGCTTTNWRAVILDGKRSDSSNDTLNALSSTTVRTTDGVGLKWDTDVAFLSTIALVPQEARKMPFYTDTRSNILMENPWVGTMTAFVIGNATSTYGSGTSVYSLESCIPVLSITIPSETCTTMYSTAAGATTANKIFDYTPFGILGQRNAKLIARLTNSAAAASTVHYAYGLQWFYR